MLSKNIAQSLRPGLELRPLDAEKSALTREPYGEPNKGVNAFAQSCSSNITITGKSVMESYFPLRLTFPRNRCIRGQTASTLSFVMSIRVPHAAKIDYLSRWGFPAEKRPPRSMTLSSNHCYLMLNWRRIGAKDSLNPSTANLDAQ